MSAVRRRLAAMAVGSVVVSLLAGGCSAGASGPPSAAALLPDISAAAGASEGPYADDPPAELLIERAPTKQSQRLLEKTLQQADFCETAMALANSEEPQPHDLEELVTYASTALTAAKSLRPNSRVTNPDRRTETIPLPDQLYELVQVVRAELYAYQVRLLYIKALDDRGLIDEAEANRRLDQAFLKLYQSKYTAADREIVKLYPRFC